VDAIRFANTILDYMTENPIPPNEELVIRLDAPEHVLPYTIGVGGNVRVKRVLLDGREIHLHWRNKAAVFEAFAPCRHVEVWVQNMGHTPTFCGVMMLVRKVGKR
jgi:hypothetical protein